MVESSLLNDFDANLTKVLEILAESAFYKKIDEMYSSGRIQKDSHDKYMLAFHEKALSLSMEMAQNLALKGAILAEDINIKKEQVKTEKERTKLIKQQTVGFLDNRVIEWNKIATEGVGMVQSGGNTAPQEMIDAMTQSQADIKTLAQSHPDLATTP